MMEVNLKSQLQVLFIAVITACLVVGFLPLEGWLLKYCSRDFLPLHNLHFLQVALLLAALCLTIYVVMLRAAKVDSANMVLFHILIGLLIVHSSCTLVIFWKYVTHRIPDMWTEEITFLSAAQSEGISGLYSISNLLHPPILISIYNPLYYLVQKFLFLFFGEFTTVGRCVSVVAVIVIGVLLGILSRKDNEKTWQFTAPLLFISIFPAMSLSASLAKPEFLGASLSLCGLLIYLKRGLEEGKRWIFWSSILFGLALLSKPTLFAGFLAIAVHLLWEKRYRECVSFVSLVFIWVFGVYAALWWPTEGGIWFMTVVANAAKFTPIKIIDLGFRYYMTSPFVVLALAACTILLSRSRSRRPDEAVVSLYFLIALCWFIISIGRPGSGKSYFIEAAISGSLVIGILISKYAAEKNRDSFKLVLIVLTISMFIRIAPQFALTSREYYAAGEQDQITKVLFGLKTHQDEYILADPYYTLDVIQAGHQPLIIDSLQYTLMIDNGIVNTNLLMDYLQNDKVPYLVLENTLFWHSNLSYGARYWPENVLKYLRQNYTCTTNIDTNRRFDNRKLVIYECNK